MSRVAKNPITIPLGVTVVLTENNIKITGAKGSLEIEVSSTVKVDIENNILKVASGDTAKNNSKYSGTARAIISNMVIGVSKGFERKLNLVGVGYRAQAKGDLLTLSLGYSHPIEFKVPDGILVETPNQTEIVIRGCDKQLVGQVSANIRAFRSPEPYKGKGVRYSDEQIVRKEAKKK